MQKHDKFQGQDALTVSPEDEDPNRFCLLYGFSIIFIISAILWAFIISMGGVMTAFWRYLT